jgi:omega-hydroxy-beta-dihydromenaquinone-9 sulfotransferase
MLVGNALLSSFFAVIEELIYGNRIRKTVIEKPPVFIIGHWRTGSTFLHQLLNLDPQFTTPTTVQTVIPDHFLFSTRYYTPVMKLFTTRGRPMDEVKVMPSEPQEDEFALIRMGSESPMERLFFPAGDHYFLTDYDEYIPKGKKLDIWKRNLLTFYKKITFLTGKQIVSKNPFHTRRMSVLAEMFPGSRFIHIYRSPCSVVPSTIRMWNMIADSNSLKNTWKTPGTDEVAAVLRTYIDSVAGEKEKLNRNQFTEIAFEDLENDTTTQLKRIYAELELDYSETFDNRVKEFLQGCTNYKKNTYQLGDQEKKIILSHFEKAIH